MDIGKNYNGTDFMNYLHITYLNDGSDNEVEKIYGHENSIASGLTLSYFGGTSPHYSVDRLTSLDAQLLFSCENNYGRMFFYENNTYKVVTSSILIGALNNGDSLNLKPYIISEIVNLFMGYDPYTSVNDYVQNSFHAKNFPNPFSRSTTIEFTIEKPAVTTVEIFDAEGRMISQLMNRKLTPGHHSVVWNGKTGDKNDAKSGIYFYRISSGSVSSTGHIMLIRN